MFKEIFTGQVTVTLTELFSKPQTQCDILQKFANFSRDRQFGKAIRLIYSDGGPDHRVSYPSVKLLLIAMFLLDNCDYVLAMRTAPHQSYRNWVRELCLL